MSFFRSTYLIGSLGAISASGTGIVGWQTYEEFNPTGDRALRRKGLVYGPIKFEENVMNVADSNNSNNKFFSKTYECFSKFFNVSDFTFEADENESSKVNGININSPISSGNSSNSIGCTIMQLSRGPKNEGFVFLSETAIKNDKVGMVVGSGAKNVNFNNDASHGQGNTFFRYYVLFLEKTNATGSIKGGVGWDDYTASSSYGDAKIKIISPEKQLDQSYSAQTVSEREKPSDGNGVDQRYSGVWEISNSSDSGSKIFEEIKVLSAQSNTEYPEALGVDGTTISEGTVGYKSVSNTGSSGNKWVKTCNATGHDVSDHLKKGYEPFKDVKGNWRNLESYCWDKSSIRNASDDEIQFLENFCYKTAQ